MLVENLVKSTLGIKDHRIVRVTQDHSGLQVQIDIIKQRRPVCSKCSL